MLTTVDRHTNRSQPDISTMSVKMCPTFLQMVPPGRPRIPTASPLQLNGVDPRREPPPATMEAMVRTDSASTQPALAKTTAPIVTRVTAAAEDHQPENKTRPNIQADVDTVAKYIAYLDQHWHIPGLYHSATDADSASDEQRAAVAQSMGHRTTTTLGRHPLHPPPLLLDPAVAADLFLDFLCSPAITGSVHRALIPPATADRIAVAVRRRSNAFLVHEIIQKELSPSQEVIFSLVVRHLQRFVPGRHFELQSRRPNTTTLFGSVWWVWAERLVYGRDAQQYLACAQSFWTWRERCMEACIWLEWLVENANYIFP
ncbi:hypothetical protein BC828DRAFT_149727 [Blastocladiella britannica]|nr:hypothetical protein BC828DRAFT_149727 [Blastocladiella britannica]